jgi:hypothetical protein
MVYGTIEVSEADWAEVLEHFLVGASLGLRFYELWLWWRCVQVGRRGTL